MLIKNDILSKGSAAAAAAPPTQSTPSSVGDDSTTANIASPIAANDSSPPANRHQGDATNEAIAANCESEKQQAEAVTIIHFNDCYNVEPSPQSSGAAGFLTAVNQHRHLNPMILFSGDILSPSFMSTFTKGEQMIPVLNDIRVDCAVFGNHEFDYGVDNLIDFVKRTTFPWLLSNVIDKETSNQLGDGQVYHIIEREGIKFGLIGLIEEEWLSTLSTLDSSDVIYQDFVTRGRELALWLKSEPNNVDYVIALTHFRTPNDIRLADSVPEIDLILGGHDHDYEIIKRPNCYIIKSGTDFREFSKITLKIDPKYMEFKRQQVNSNSSELETNSNNSGKKKQLILKPFLDLEIEHIKCLSYKPDEQLKTKLDKFVTTIDEKMDKVLAQFNCDLDGRFASIRKGETNLGNFVCDIMLASTHADLAILNSGTLRSDRIHPRGEFTMRDLFNILGYIDPIAVLEATGRQIWRALENGVSQWPKLEGRFPQVSGCSFIFDPSKLPMQRIDPKDIMIGDEPLILDKTYRLTTKSYLASGKDGYDIFKECQVIVPGDESPDLTTSILNHFEAINIVKSNRRTHHRQSIICMSRTSLLKIMDHCSNHCISHSDEAATTPPAHPRTCVGFDVCIGGGSARSGGALMVNTALPEEESEELGICLAHHDKNNNDGDGDVYYVAAQNQQQQHASMTTSNGSHERQFLASSPILGTRAPRPPFRSASVAGGVGGFGETELVATSCDANIALGTPPPMQREPRAKRLMSLYEIEHEQCKLEPKIEGRIRIVGTQSDVDKT